MALTDKSIFRPNDFEEIDDEKKQDIIDNNQRASTSYLQDVWRRLKKNHTAMFGLIIIVLLILIALFGPMLSSYSYEDQNLNFISTPPRIEIRQVDEDSYIYVHQTLKVFTVTADGELLEPVAATKKDVMNKINYYEVDGHNLEIDYNNSTFTITDENDNLISVTDKVWNKRYLLGSDQLGRDMLTRVIYGARVSLIIGFVASFVNLTVGILYGGFSGYMGGVVDDVMMRFVDIMRSIPRLLYVIVIMVIVGSGLKTVVLVIGLVYWLGMSRIVRGQVLSLKRNDYVLAARTMGANTWNILTKHLIPNAAGPIIIVTAMRIPGAIFTEAFLSFVGLGVSAPKASWGTMCNEAISSFQIYPYQLFVPAMAICFTVLAFNLMGDGLRDSLDPKLRK